MEEYGASSLLELAGIGLLGCGVGYSGLGDWYNGSVRLGWAGRSGVRLTLTSAMDMSAEGRQWFGLRAYGKAGIVFSRTSLARE